MIQGWPTLENTMNKPTINMNLRLPTELHRKLSAKAKRENRSLHGQILHELQTALAGEPDPGGDALKN